MNTGAADIVARDQPIAADLPLHAEIPLIDVGHLEIQRKVRDDSIC